MKIIIVAMGCMINHKREVLLALRNDPKNPEFHHKWQLPGGAVEDNESVSKAVIREIKEETGLDVEITSDRPAVAFGVINERKHSKNTRILLIAYSCKQVGGVLGKNIAAETARLEWFSKEKIPWKQVLPGNKEIIREFLKKSG